MTGCGLKLRLSEQLIGREGKGRRGRRGHLAEATVWALQEYVRAWRLKAEGEIKVFVGRKGRYWQQGMSVRAMQRRRDHYARKGKLTASCHGLRHTMAMQLLNYGADLVTVQELLGHSKVTSTQRYARVSNNRVKQDDFEGMKRILSKQ